MTEETPHEKWEKLEERLSEPMMEEAQVRALDEALYTYSETHDFKIDRELALLIWGIVDWAAYEATPEEVEEIRL